MPSASQKMQIPVDANSNPLNRSMGIPLTVVRKLTSSTQWCDVFDLSDYGPRVFIGLMAQNPSATLKVQLSFDEEPVGDEEAAITVLSQGTIAVDNLTFGPGVNDFTYGTRVMRLRGRLLGGSTGTLSSATITYSGTNVTDGMQVQINGTTYEFSADLSAAGGVIAVALGANADASWTALAAAVNAQDGNVYCTLNTGTNVFTVSATKGGTDGDGVVVADGAGGAATGATFSGNTTGGAGGVELTINIW
jgi:hypothetical protein